MKIVEKIGGLFLVLFPVASAARCPLKSSDLAAVNERIGDLLEEVYMEFCDG
ncbi:MAG TPA: hypothetical protein VGC97_16845 [Pyrinomonadaceae bacterium]|jgi:hypothetical protein